jgi:uncharacterized protein YneF (UPF0154 family)
MTRGLSVIVVVLCLLVFSTAQAQEAKIDHGFLFFAGESYTMDEKTYGIYENGNEYSAVIRNNPEAVAAFKSYRILHITAIVSTGLSIAAFVFGGAYYIFEKDLSKSLGKNAGVISFASGGGLLALGVAFEFIAWGRISSSAKIYNKGLMEEPLAEASRLPMPSLMLAKDSAQLMLTWIF